MLRLYFLLLLNFCKSSHSGPAPTSEVPIDEELGETRRILRGHEIFDTRPYMVWLRPTHEHTPTDANWLCGGVIIDERYILTSAACIEDITFFYVVYGTHKWLPLSQTNECIENGATRAIWKCVPRTYRYDGGHYNNIRWMVNDIAVVMTEEAISFDKRVKGCDFIPHKIGYNNLSNHFEHTGMTGFIAGWGSTDKYTDAADIIARTSVNSPILQETASIVIQKSSCKAHWLPRYHGIIDNYMICGKVIPTIQMSVPCEEKHTSCRQLVFSEEEGPRSRRFESNPDQLLLHSAQEVKKRQQIRKKNGTRRLSPNTYSHGGFCENDHGGPLVMGRGRAAIVVGIISAYLTRNNTKQCFGPYLYTSVWNNRHLIQCALYKELGNKCASVIRDTASVLEEESFDWGNVAPRNRVYEEEETPDLVTKQTRKGRIYEEDSTHDTSKPSVK